MLEFCMGVLTTLAVEFLLIIFIAFYGGNEK